MDEPPNPDTLGALPGSNSMMVLALVLLILCSAFFSASETSFSSLNRIRMKTRADSGEKKAKLVLKLYENYDKLLTTILIGNNIVNISATSIATVLFVRLYGDIGATIATAVITVVVLIFGEISPKSLAKEQPERFALLFAPLLRLLTILFTPVNFLFSQWKALLSRLFRAKPSESMTEDELLTLVDEAEQEGAIDEDDKELINNVIEFNDHTVEEILTPRVDITAVCVDDSLEEIAKTFAENGFSRLPVYEEDLDDILGVIHLRDFYDQVQSGKRTLKDVVTPAIFVTHSMKISELLKLFQKKKIHIAIVTDKYGGTEGMVTMEDILEELVGEIWDESDEVTEDFVQLTEHAFLVDCSTELGEFLDFFQIEGEFESSTVSGWIMEMLSKVPEQGDVFSCAHQQVIVTKVDHRRAVECVVERRIPPPKQEAEMD